MLYQRLGESNRHRPVARIVVTNPDPNADTEPLEIDAVLDTGADLTCLLETHVAALGLSPIAPPVGVTTAGGRARLQKYAANIEFPVGTTKTVVVLAISGPYPALGRNVLNDFSVCFDGPNQTWHIPFVNPL
jgi:predicted aspartyl protease